MVDVVDPPTRSRMMSGIRGRNTRPELLVRSLLHRQGFRFRIHVRTLPGTPDIVLARHHAVINIMGCFWHGHECANFRWPGSRAQFWKEKIEKNRARDKRNHTSLEAAGWRVATIWECSLRGPGAWPQDRIIDALTTWLRSNSPMLTVSTRKNEHKVCE